ncbi:hypothetical protein QUG65_22875 [Enterobacter asburiae]|uniref:hypothetical protein n=1 Tax=Enterobacter asburiae TaxID=61645 RepID=UPI0025A2A627|nr:hypothetical protein [Enterobacter asburiae]MDM7074606.1 hypothetical protein [Enterobacter asburiae]
MAQGTESLGCHFALSRNRPLIRHFNSKDSSVSVALNQVNQEDWKAQVWDTEIGPKLDELIKKPGYSM